MSSVDKKSDKSAKIGDEGVKDKDKTIGDGKTDTTAHKRSSSEVNSADDEGKQKILKTDHKDKDKDKENGESEEKFEEGGDDDDDVVPEGDEYDDEGEGDDDDEGADEEGDEDEDDA